MDTIPKSWLTFFRCSECQTVYALTIVDERYRRDTFGDLYCTHSHGVVRVRLQLIDESKDDEN